MQSLFDLLVELGFGCIQKIDQAMKFWMILLPSIKYGPFWGEDSYLLVTLCLSSRNQHKV